MTKVHPDEIFRARYFVEIGRVRKHLERYTTGEMRLFERSSPLQPMRDITEAHVQELTAQIAELELFLAKVKAPVQSCVSMGGDIPAARAR